MIFDASYYGVKEARMKNLGVYGTLITSFRTKITDIEFYIFYQRKKRNKNTFKIISV